MPTRWLVVSHAFHSPLMEPMLGEFGRALTGVDCGAPVSAGPNPTGQLPREGELTADCWLRQIREPVQFHAGLSTLRPAEVELFLELGPHPTLSTLGLEYGGSWTASLRRDADDWTQMRAVWPPCMSAACRSTGRRSWTGAVASFSSPPTLSSASASGMPDLASRPALRRGLLVPRSVAPSLRQRRPLDLMGDHRKRRRRRGTPVRDAPGRGHIVSRVASRLGRAAGGCAARAAGVRRLLCLWPLDLDHGLAPVEAAVQACATLLPLCSMTRVDPRKVSVWIATRDAQCAAQRGDPRQAAVWRWDARCWSSIRS